MAIEAFSALTGGAAGIDNTFGYNDMILTPGSGALPIGIRDRLSERDAAGANPSAGLSDAVAEGAILPGDRLFRLPNGGILLRRSVFADACMPGSSRPNNSLLISEPMSRALAFFGANYQGSDPSGDLWCRRSVPGTAGNAETPWDVSTLGGLRSIEQVLERIRAVRTAGASGALPADIQPAQAALARELASATAIPDAELTALATDIRTRRERLESAGDMFMRHPVLHTLGIAVLFGVGTDAYHLVRYLVAGGKSPFEGPLSIFGGLRSIYRGIVDFFTKRPPSDGPGASGNSGGGGANPPSGGGNPPSNVSHMSALPDVAAGILAFNGGAGPVGVTGNGVAPVPAVGVPVANPGVFAVPVIPAPVAVPAPVVAPVVAVPRFVPAF